MTGFFNSNKETNKGMAKRKLKCLFIVFVAKMFIKPADEAKTFSETEEQAPTQSAPSSPTRSFYTVTVTIP